MIFSKDQSTYESSSYGGNAGTNVTWHLPKNERIKKIIFRSGERVNSITFETNSGTKSPRFGQDGGD